MAKGWRNESRRHSLASRGVKTAVNNPKEKAMYKVLINPTATKDEDKAFIGAETEKEARRKAREWGLNPDTVFKDDVRNDKINVSKVFLKRIRDKTFDIYINADLLRISKRKEDIDFYDSNIRQVFDYYSSIGLPMWKQNLLFDKAEKLIEDESYTITQFNKDVDDIVTEPQKGNITQKP